MVCVSHTIKTRNLTSCKSTFKTDLFSEAAMVAVTGPLIMFLTELWPCCIGPSPLQVRISKLRNRFFVCPLFYVFYIERLERTLLSSLVVEQGSLVCIFLVVMEELQHHLIFQSLRGRGTTMEPRTRMGICQKYQCRAGFDAAASFLIFIWCAGLPSIVLHTQGVKGLALERMLGALELVLDLAVDEWMVVQ